MRVDRHCYEVLAESSTWEAMMGKIGSWLILGSIVGFLVALWWYFRHHVREQ
jgi:cbb3-type cytochrome oxidase subunit 3